MSVLDRLTTALADRYRVERELGAGGMATVYLAHDLRHERDVAIKVLHPDLGAALGADRFLTEIKTTAKLQHPHILPLLDSGTADGLLYYVMPYVSGETLRSRLDRERQLPVPDALRIAREVAAALEHAHKQGIIHRDIKPENILLQDGAAVVADFGIALAVQQAGGQRMTHTGLSLGTPQYMSPEQAMGEKGVDARSDIYALGAVTYEMLAGEPPFTGASTQAIVARILTEDPRSLTAQRKTIAPGVDAAVRQALEKQPADRFLSAAEFAEALLLDEPRATSLGSARRVHRPARGIGAGVIAAAVVAGAVIGAGGLWLTGRETTPPVARYRLAPWRDTRFGIVNNIYRTRAALAPDGSSLVYSDSSDGRRRLFRKMRDADVASEIAGSEGGESPFFSPDGSTIAFFTRDGALKRVSAAGGAPVVIVPRVAGVNRVGAWLDDGSILYVDGDNTMVRVSELGAELSRMNRPFTVQQIAPTAGGGAVMLTCPRNCGLGTVFVGLTRTMQSVELVRLAHESSMLVAPTGHLLWLDASGRIVAQRLNAEVMRLEGTPAPVSEGPVQRLLAISGHGDLLYEGNPTAQAPMQIVIRDRAGRTLAVDSTPTTTIITPAMSPDGAAVAVSTLRQPVLSIYRAGTAPVRVRANGVSQWRPVWFDGGRTLGFLNADTAGRAEVYRMDIDGGTPRRWLTHPDGIAEFDVAAGGAWMVYRLAPLRFQEWPTYVRPMSGDTTPIRILSDVAQPSPFSLSPDGRWLAYATGESGARELFVTSVPDGRIKRRIAAGDEPRFARGGRELFFVQAGNLVAVAITNSERFEVGASTVLFSVEGYRRAANRQQYDVGPDDQSFVMLREPVTTVTSTLVLSEHWITELRARAPK